jgi:hypothetical protein
MLNGIPGGGVLYSAKGRRTAMVIAAFFLAAGLFVLIINPGNSVKIPMLYLLTLCMMYLLVAYKNSLNKYEIGIFFVLCFQLISVAPGFGEMDLLVAASYLLSYRYGVSSRSFMGTVVDILTGGAFVSKQFVWHFIFSSLVFLSFLVSVYLGYIIQKTKDAERKFTGLLALVYLSCFTAPSAHFIPANFGRVELFAFIFMLALPVVIEKPRFRWIIPLFALFAMSIHLILVFFYIPFIFIMLLYPLLEKESSRKENILLPALTFVLIVAAFLLYLLYHEQTFVFQDAREMSEYLRTKSDLVFDDAAIHFTLYAKLRDHLAGWNENVGLAYSGNLSVIINIPLTALFVLFWINCFRQEKKSAMKFFFTLPVLVLFYHAISFFLFYDFGRWMVMILNIQFMLVFYLIHARNETVLSVVNRAAPFIVKNRFIILLLCVLMSFLGPVTQVGPSEKFGHIEKGIMLILGKIQ